MPIRTDAYPHTYILGFQYLSLLFPPAFSTKVLRVSTETAKGFHEKCQEFSQKVPRVLRKSAKRLEQKCQRTTDSRLSLDSPPALPKGREQLLVKAEDVVILLLSGICSLPLGCEEDGTECSVWTRSGGESRESLESV